MAEPRAVPADFGARLRAARAYADDISREDFAERLNLAGASASNVRVWEAGRRQPSLLVAEALIPRIAEATGIEEAFLWGGPDPAADRLDAIEDALAALRLETEARDLEVLRLLGEALPPEAGSPPQRQQ